MATTAGERIFVARGMLIMASSSVLFSAMSLLIPLTRSVNTSIVVSARFVTGIVVILGLALTGFTRLQAVNRWWLIVRGIIGATSVYFFFRGITMLGLGKGTVLNYTYPIFAALLAPLVVKEKLSWDVLAAALVSFIGIWLVVNPGTIASHRGRGPAGAPGRRAFRGGRCGHQEAAGNRLALYHLSRAVRLRPAGGRLADGDQLLPFRRGRSG